jgi:cysteine desulfurase
MAFVEILEPHDGDVKARDEVEARSINLDANANAPATQPVIDAIVAALRGPTNPSSSHYGGAQARTLLADARDAVASLAEGLLDDGVIFTSGCTEANNMVLNTVRAARGTLITSQVEHPSILAPARDISAQGCAVLFLPVSSDGIVDLDSLVGVLNETKGPFVLSIQTANSETGVIQPIEAIAKLVAGRDDVIFHTDAAQSFGKLPLRLGGGLGPSVATMSGHKLHGPMGVGAVMLASGEDRIGATLLGGDQQRGMRAGTEALPLIAGLSAACAERARNLDADVAKMKSARDRLEQGVLHAVAGTVINGSAAARLPNTSSIRFPGLDAMALVAHLDAEGILVSQGSACSSMRPTPSHVLLAMGLSEDEAFSTVRFSTSPLTTADEIEEAIQIVAVACRQLGAFA